MEFDLSLLNEIGHCKKIGVKFPNYPSEILAELIGAHYGDGCLCKSKNFNYSISYSGNLKKDYSYLTYLNDIILSLFNIKFNFQITKKKSLVVLYRHSKKLFYFYKKCLQIKSGPKKDLKIPSYIKKDKKLLIRFIRGLFDTDGCVTLQRDRKYRYILIKICTKHKNFAEELKFELQKLGLRSFITQKKNKNIIYDVVLRHKNAYEFFNLIGSSNSRNIKKFLLLIDLIKRKV